MEGTDKICPRCRNRYSCTIEYCICGARLEMVIKPEGDLLEQLKDMFRFDAKS